MQDQKGSGDHPSTGSYCRGVGVFNTCMFDNYFLYLNTEKKMIAGWGGVRGMASTCTHPNHMLQLKQGVWAKWWTGG